MYSDEEIGSIIVAEAAREGIRLYRSGEVLMGEFPKGHPPYELATLLVRYKKEILKVLDGVDYQLYVMRDQLKRIGASEEKATRIALTYCRKDVKRG